MLLLLSEIETPKFLIPTIIAVWLSELSPENSLLGTLYSKSTPMPQPLCPKKLFLFFPDWEKLPF